MRRNIEIPFSELKKILEDKGVVFNKKEYIRDVQWQMAYPEQIVFIGIESNE